MSVVLIISCSTGGGHTTAQYNVSHTLQQMGHDIVNLDIASFFFPVQHMIASSWDTGVRRDWRIVHDLDGALTFYERIYEFLWAKPLTRHLNELIKRHQITQIYDMQPTFTNLILSIFSKACPQGEYHKIFTDLPYPGNRAYLGSLKRTKHRDNIALFVHAPTTVPMPSTQDFWQDYAGISSSQLKQTFALPVHELYFDANYKIKPLALSCPLTRYCDHSLQATESGYIIRPGTTVTTLMLGSQGLHATLDYAKQFLMQAKQTDKAALFFVACAKNMKLYDELMTYANSHNLPHAQVLPLPQISQQILASIMWQSDRYIIRPSGLSCLEQLALRQDHMNAQKPLWIHSGMNSLTHKHLSRGDLLRGCFGHERANAEHMLASTPSQMVIPSTVVFF